MNPLFVIPFSHSACRGGYLISMVKIHYFNIFWLSFKILFTFLLVRNHIRKPNNLAIFLSYPLMLSLCIEKQSKVTRMDWI